MKVAVCDEDRESLARLRRMVKEQEPECEVVCFDSGRKFLEAGQHFDILLLEIQMAEISGLEVARALRAGRESTVLIFVTALKEYAPEAFEVSAFRYLLKPLSPEKFRRAFRDACREALGHLASGGEPLFFRTRTRNFTLHREEVIYVESRRRKVDIHTQGECFSVYATMTHREEELGEGFFRCHRGYLVNLACVAGYGGGFVLLQNGEQIYLAREKQAEFSRAYARFRAN